jgi:hypothetical protein
VGGLAAEWTAQADFEQALTHIMGAEAVARVAQIMAELDRLDREIEAQGMGVRDLPALATEHRLAYQTAAFHLGIAMGAILEVGAHAGIAPASATTSAKSDA